MYRPTLHPLQLMTMALLCAIAVSCKRNHPTRGESYDTRPLPIVRTDTLHTSQERHTPPFETVFVRDADSVTITLTDSAHARHEVSITGPHTYVRGQQYAVRDGHLYVKYDNRDTRYRQTHVHIAAPHLSSIQVYGCNVVSIEGHPMQSASLLLDLSDVQALEGHPQLTAETIDLRLTRSRHAAIRVKCRDLRLTSNQSADISLAGHCHKASISGDTSHQLDLGGLRQDR